jgi:hypothetical protein
MAKKITSQDLFEGDIFATVRESVEQTIGKIQTLNSELTESAKLMKGSASGIKTDSAKGQKDFNKFTQEANQLKREKIELEKQEAQLQALLNKAKQEELKAAKAANVEAERQAKAQEKAVKQAQAESSAYAQKSKQLRELQKAWKDLAVQNKENTADAQKLLTEIQDLDAELKAVDATVGQHQRNVGNYGEATQNLKKELRELTKALQTMESTDPRFQEMAIKAGELKDQIADTQAIVKSTAGTAVENLGTGLAKAGKVGIDAFAGMTGAMGLFGIQSEGAMQTMAKLQELAAMSDALQSLGALGDTMNEVKASFIAAATKLGLFSAAKKADTAITIAQDGATKAATTSTNLLGKAMTALPIVAIIAGIAGLVAMVYNLASANAEARRQQDLLKKANEQAAAKTNKITESNKKWVEEQKKLLDRDIRQRKIAGENVDKLEKERLERQKKIDRDAVDRIKYQMKVRNEQLTQMLLLQDEEKEEGNQRMARIKMGEILRKDFGKTEAQTSTLTDSYFLFNAEVQRLTEEVVLLSESKQEFQDILEDSDLKLQEYNVEVKNHTVNVQGNTAATKEQTKAMKDANDQIERTISLMNETDALVEEIGLYEAGENIAFAVQSQLDGIAQSGQYSIDIIDQLIDQEYELRKAILERQYQQAIEGATTEQEVLNAQMRYNHEVEKLDKETKDKKEQIYDELETAQEDYDAKRLESERTTNEALKKSAEETAAERNKWAETVANYFIEQSNRKIAQIDKEKSAAESQFDYLKQLAAQRNIDAKESLAEQQRIIDEANAKKERELKRQQRIKLAEAIYSTYNQKVAENSDNPLMETMRDAALLQQFIMSLPTFFDGTEDTGINGKGIDGKGGFHAILHPNERVIPKSLNDHIGGMSNEALTKLAMEYQAGKVVRSDSQIGSAYETALLVNEVRDLKDVIRNKPETNIELGEITQSVMNIVKSSKQGHTTIYNRYRIRS